MTFNPHIPLRQNGVLHRVVVRRKPSPTTHATNASGGPQHGSLDGFRTHWGMEINAAGWEELGGNHPLTCHNCNRAIEKRLREAGAL